MDSVVAAVVRALARLIDHPHGEVCKHHAVMLVVDAIQGCTAVQPDIGTLIDALLRGCNGDAAAIEALQRIQHRAELTSGDVTSV